MLRITVELVPHGDEDRAKEIAQMVIANDGTGDPYLGNYEGWIGADEYTDEPAKFGIIKGHDRSKGVWELVRLMLKSILHENHTPNQEKQSLSQRLLRRLAGREE